MSITTHPCAKEFDKTIILRKILAPSTHYLKILAYCSHNDSKFFKNIDHTFVKHKHKAQCV